MGLLDDAIREHLELKRRRGADPAEVEKQEREALGPVGAAAVEQRAAPPPDEPPAADFDDDPDPFADAHQGLEDVRTPEPAGAVRAPDPPAREDPPPVSQPTEQYSVDDLEGAYGLAERVRAGIEALRIPLPDGAEPLRVSASFGAAALPESAHDQGSLIAAADGALYAAKRAGKNRTMRAEPQGARPSG